MKKMNFIEIMIETHPVDDTYYTSHRKHIFFTHNNYSHEEIANIMKSIKQKYYTNDDCGYGETEIDMSDLRNQLSEFGIYELIPVERYYFDIEEDK